MGAEAQDRATSITGRISQIAAQLGVEIEEEGFVDIDQDTYTMYPFFYVLTGAGLRRIDAGLAEAARSLGAGPRQVLFRVVLPSASPQIFAGARISLSLAVIMMVVSEMVGSTNGIGYFVLQSQRTYAITAMWSGIFLLAILGYVLNALFLLVERRVLRWHRGARAGAG